MPCSFMEWLNIVDMSVFQMSLYTFKKIPIKNIFEESDNLSKICFKD